MALEDIFRQTSMPAVPKQAAALAEGEGTRRMNSGFFGDLFDYLSRPARASAAAVYSQIDDDPTTQLGSSIVNALLGKSDITYKDVAEKAGLTGAPAAVAGFAGDVLLDPLTYVGIKTTKGAPLPALEKLAIESAASKGLFTSDAVGAELARIQSYNPNKKRMLLTFAGREVGGVDMPSAATKAKDLVIGPESDRRTLAKAFSKKSELPFGLADQASIAESRSAAEYQDFMRGLNNLFVRNLSVKERKLIMEALDSGKTLNAPLQIPDAAHPAGFQTLEDYRQLSRRLLDSFFDDEVAKGAYSPLQKADNYVPLYFRKPPKDVLPGEAEQLGFLPAGPNIVRLQQRNPELKNMSLAVAKQKGYDPIDDIAEALQIRSAKHFRIASRQDFLNEAVSKFGIRADDPALKDLVRSGELPSKYVRLDEAFGRDEAKKLLSPAERKNFDEVTEIAKTDKDVKPPDFPEIYLPRQVAFALAAAKDVLSIDTVGSKFMRAYDGALREWKFLNTGAMPGYHIRNSFTDALMNAADGVWDPKYYRRARKIQQDAKASHAAAVLQRAQNDGAELLDETVDRVLNFGNKKVSSAELWKLYGRSGAKSGFIDTELFRAMNPLERQALTDASLRSKIAATPLAGYDKLKQKIGEFSDTRENLFRLAHFIKALEDEAPKYRTLEEAAEAAGARVRKYNIDYGDLSSFERRAMNKAIPFYSWMRRNLPLQIEMLFTKPGFMALYPKGQDLMQGLLGTDDGEGDFLVPQWIRDVAPVRMALAKNEANSPIAKAVRWLSGAGPGEGAVINLGSQTTPIGDFALLTDPLNAAQREGPMGGVTEAASKVVNMITPFVKAPVELATGRQLFTNAEIKNWDQWLLSQVGPSRVAAQGFGVGSGDPQARTLSSTFLGVPLQPITADRQASEFRRREDVLTALRSSMKDRELAQMGFDPASVPEANAASIKARVETPETQQLKLYLRALQREAEARNAR